MEDQRPQATFDVSQLELDVETTTIYGMDWKTFVKSKYTVHFTRRDVHDNVATSLRAHIGEDYYHAYQHMYDTRQMSKMQDILSNLAKLGCCKWQYENSAVYKRTLQIRSCLYDTDYRRYKEIFGWGGYQKASEDGRRDVNIIISSEEVLPVVSGYAAYMNVSNSVVAAGFLGMAFLTWDELPTEARQLMENDVRQLRERMHTVSEACLQLVREAKETQ